MAKNLFWVLERIAVSRKIAKAGHPDRTRRFTIVEVTQATGQEPGADSDQVPPAAE
jgi:hypothetical protein